MRLLSPEDRTYIGAQTAQFFFSLHTVCYVGERVLEIRSDGSLSHTSSMCLHEVGISAMVAQGRATLINKHIYGSSTSTRLQQTSCCGKWSKYQRLHRLPVDRLYCLLRTGLFIRNARKTGPTRTLCF